MEVEQKVELLAKTTQKLANESDHSKIEPILNKSGAIKVTEKTKTCKTV